MNCEQARRGDLVEKYVTGQLPEQDMSVFEEHYFACDDCLASVQLAQALRSATAPAVLRMPEPRRSRPSRWMYPMAAAAAIVLTTFVGWSAFRGGPAKPQLSEVRAPPQPAVPNRVPVVPEPAKPQLMASTVVDLGAISALPYRAAVMRGSNDDSLPRFQQAMIAYQNRDYRGAVSHLSVIPVGVPGSGQPEDHVTDAGVQLYLGVSQLMLNQNAEATRSLRRSASYGDTPYLENAQFYLAKALIRQKQNAPAAVELRHIVKLNGDRQAEARLLLNQLSLR